MVNKWGERGREGKQKGKLARERNRIPFPFPPPVVFPFIFRFFFFFLKWRTQKKKNYRSTLAGVYAPAESSRLYYVNGYTHGSARFNFGDTR